MEEPVLVREVQASAQLSSYECGKLGHKPLEHGAHSFANSIMGMPALINFKIGREKLSNK